MGALADSGLDRTVLKQITDKLDAEELQALKRAYQARARERYPLPVQLEYAQKPERSPGGRSIFDLREKQPSKVESE